jgi:stage IV sporulation protein FB
MLKLPFFVPLYIRPSFWLTALLIAYLNTYSLSGVSLAVGLGIWTGVILLSLVVHESGHAIAARIFGLSPTVTLEAFGGITSYKGSSEVSPAKEFFITLMGPVFGLLLCIGAYALGGYVSQPILAAAVRVTFLVNLVWSIFNLLPILPLDGGHLMRIALHAAFGVRGLKASIWISSCLSGAGAIYALLIGQIFMAAFFILFCFESIKALMLIRHYRPIDENPELRRQLEGARALSEQERYDEAIDVLVALQSILKRGMLFNEVTAELGYVYSQKGDFETSLSHFKSVEKRLSPAYLDTYLRVAYALKHYDLSLEIGTRLYDQSPDGDIALLCAKAASHVGKKEAACGWLRAALEKGVSQEVLQGEEFISLKSEEAFRRLQDFS